MKWTGGLLALLLALGVSACGDPAEDRIPGPQLLEEGAFEIVATVTVDDAGFDTESVEIDPGQVVAFEIAGSEPERIRGYIDDEIDSDTGELLPGETTLVRLANVGDVTYESVSGDVIVLTVREVDGA